MNEYVDLDNNMAVCTALFLTGRKHPGLIVKNLKAHPLTDDDLARLGAARLEEPASKTGPATGFAVEVNGVYYRDYRAHTAEELAAQRKAALAETDADMPRVVEDLIGTLIGLGVMAETDLPQVTQERLVDKRNKRAAL
jgi:hypothetical protein